jgi:hypothetical protein
MEPLELRPSGIANLHKEAFGASDALHVGLEELKRASQVVDWMCQKRCWLVTVSTVLFSFCLHILKQSDGWATILPWKPERHHYPP